MKKIIRIGKNFFKSFEFKISPSLNKGVKDCPICRMERIDEAQKFLDTLYNQSLDNLKLKINKPYDHTRTENY